MAVTQANRSRAGWNDTVPTTNRFTASHARKFEHPTDAHSLSKRECKSCALPERHSHRIRLTLPWGPSPSASQHLLSAPQTFTASRGRSSRTFDSCPNVHEQAGNNAPNFPNMCRSPIGRHACSHPITDRLSPGDIAASAGSLPVGRRAPATKFRARARVTCIRRTRVVRAPSNAAFSMVH